jgi:hypothetical protein
MSNSCNSCGSPNILINNVLDKNICGYCFFNFNNDIESNAALEIDIFNYFKDLFPNEKKYSNSILISNNNLIKSHIDTATFEQYDEKLFKKNISKLLSLGKIDRIIIPDISNVCLKSILSMDEFYSKNVDLYIGIFTPDFVAKNIIEFKKIKYIYSLLSLSKICILNNFDIHEIYHNIDYMILNIKRQNCENNDVIEELQDLWDIHALSLIFSPLK